MALKARILKVNLSIADVDRNVYGDFSLTLAQHPSENDARLMVRLLAFMLHADERLAFGRGLSSDEEPDLWLRDDTGAIVLWISLGQLDERWLRKAAGRAERVVVLAYGDRAVDVWWEEHRSRLERLANLSVYRIFQRDAEALGALAGRAMTLQCTLQEGEALIVGEGEVLRVAPVALLDRR